MNDKPITEIFSENLKRLLKKNNIKNIELANHLGYKKTAISNYIHRVSVPNIETLKRIADFFDVDYQELIGSSKNETALSFSENTAPQYKIPVFHKILFSEKVIYRNENFLGAIYFPMPVGDDTECYAVTIYDDDMKSYGIQNGSLTVFSSEISPVAYDLVAVFFKSKKRIFIRSYNCDEKTFTLNSDNETLKFKSSDTKRDAVILGKVVFATFAPNKKEL